jgi:hypothetical protein
MRAISEATLGIIHRLGRRRIDKGVRLGKHRWVVERTLSWLNHYRRLRIRLNIGKIFNKLFFLWPLLSSVGNSSRGFVRGS